MNFSVAEARDLYLEAKNTKSKLEDMSGCGDSWSYYNS